MYDEIARRLPNKVGDKARAAARERLKLEDDTALYVAIGKRQLSDDALLEALVPGIPAEMKSKPGKLTQSTAVSIEGLTPELGRASCRERVWPVGYTSLVAVSFKQQQ